MREALPYKLILLAILALTNVTVVSYLWWRNKSRVDEFTTNAGRLPPLELIDDKGTRLLLSSLIGAPVVIQFVNPEIPTQTNSVSKLVSAFNRGEVHVVVITPNSGELRKLLPELPDEVLVIQNNYEELKKAFRVPDCCERRFIYNNEGVLSYRDYYREADLTPRLNLLAHKTLPPVSTVLTEALQSCRIGPVASLREETRNEASRRAMVMLFTSVSSTCPSGELLRMAARQVKEKNADLLILVPKEFSDSDCENLKTNFKLNANIRRFDSELSEKWRTLVRQYGEAKINGTVAMVERGSVSLLADQSQVEHELARF